MMTFCTYPESTPRKGSSDQKDRALPLIYMVLSDLREAILGPYSPLSGESRPSWRARRFTTRRAAF